LSKRKFVNIGTRKRRNPMADSNVQSNEVVVTLDGRDVHIPMETLGVTIDMSDRQILTAARASILESEGVDLNDESGVAAFGVRKALNSNTIYIYPKPVAG
jgi:hypothetical protein